MSNIVIGNPIFIDTQNVTGQPALTLQSGQKKIIEAISVRASADNWSVVLHNEEGDAVPFFSQGSLISNDRNAFFRLKVPITGIFVTTLTNITNVLIYTQSSL